MDPTECLAGLLKIAARVRRVIQHGGQPSEYDANALAEGLQDLDSWLKNGGDLPAQWKPCFECEPAVSVNGRCVRHGKLLAPQRPALIPANLTP